MKKVFTLVIDEDNEPIIVEEDVILEDILNSLASISNRIGDIQLALIKNDDVDTSSDLDISKIDFSCIKKRGAKFAPHHLIIKI